jgi:hypothetical protein
MTKNPWDQKIVIKLENSNEKINNLKKIQTIFNPK